jgi:hypothetical protein
MFPMLPQRGRLAKRDRLCLLLFLAIVLLAGTVVTAQTTAAPQGSTTSSPSQSRVPAPLPLKDRAADAARSVTLWLFSLPLVPVLCFVAAAIISVLWIRAALHHRIRILTGAVTISDTPAARLHIQLSAASGYTCTLNNAGGVFTVYDIPNEPLSFEITLYDPATTAVPAPPKLTYSVPLPQKKKTLSWNVHLPLEPADWQVASLNATDRSISWKDSVPSPPPTAAALHYTFAAEVRESGSPAFVPLAVTAATPGVYTANAKKESIVKVTTKIDGLPNEFSRHFSIP